jgi:Rap1a immunity proteins
MKTGLLAVILLLPAFAAAKTGNELQGECSAALKLFNKEPVAGEDDFIKIGHCIGFVTGVMQTAALGKASPRNRSSKEPVRDFCDPPDLSVEQVVRTALKRLQSKPEELNLDASVIVLRALNEGFPSETCIEGPGRQAEGLHWPDPPRKEHMRVRLVALALALPRTSFFSSEEVLVAEREIGDEEWGLIKLVFTYLPYQPAISESGFDYSMVHEIAAWRNTDCDETVELLTARSMPDRFEPLIYSRNVPRADLDGRRIPLPCYETKAGDYIKSSLEPIPPPLKPPPRPVLLVRPDTAQVRPEPAPTASASVLKAPPSPTPTPSERPVLKVRPTPE